MMAYATSVAGRQLFDKSFERSKLTKLTDGLAAQFRSRIARTPGAIRRLRRSAAANAALFDDLDVMVSPTLAHLPPEIGHLGTDLDFAMLFPRVEKWVAFTPLANATGAPAISLPLGHDDETNLPVGMMFSAALGNDGLLLRLALELEAAHPFRSLADNA